MDKCLKEFEEWFLKHKEKEQFDADLSKTNGRYNYTRTLNLWLGWKASRESMKAIKLPESKETYHMAQHCMTKMIDLNDTIRVITSAGHKVEG